MFDNTLHPSYIKKRRLLFHVFYFSFSILHSRLFLFDIRNPDQICYSIVLPTSLIAGRLSASLFRAAISESFHLPRSALLSLRPYYVSVKLHFCYCSFSFSFSSVLQFIIQPFGLPFWKPLTFTAVHFI